MNQWSLSHLFCYLQFGHQNQSLIRMVGFNLDVMDFVRFTNWICISVSLTDCAASQFCIPGTDIYSNCPTFWRVSKSHSQSLDVWKTVHIL